MPPPKVYLLSRTLDPLLGLFTGALAYKLHETNPRSAPPEGHTLAALASWRWGLARDRREAVRVASSLPSETDQGADGEWERVRREFEAAGMPGAAGTSTGAGAGVTEGQAGGAVGGTEGRR